MAELILSSVGAVVGGAVAGPFGAAVGAGLGGAVGRRLDDAVFGDQRRIEGPRLAAIDVQGASEGAGVPLVYGRMRIAGQVIWAARPKEHRTSRRSGAKGARTTVVEQSYTLSFAVGLCEGEALRIERAWANGAPLDLSQVAWRLHPGSHDQAPDPLIEAIEGVDDTPAYRGLAYVVFEDLPLTPFGGSMPNLTFEIVMKPKRPAGEARLETLARGVCLIPGAGEFALATTPVRRRNGPGDEVNENVHAAADRSDLEVSLDQLAQDLPECRSVMLVVGWFGDDLRAGFCNIRPGVEQSAKATSPVAWRVETLGRGEARLVSRIDGAPAYGGTPSDDGVREAIAALKARGYRVGLYPFLFMDVPPGSALPDPYGGLEQAPYPWRGRITGSDGAGAAREEITRFFEAGPWSYRRFILHYANLAAAAGGVDAFVIGSELRGLTTLRDDTGAYPAVAALKRLATAARAALPQAKLTYAADWSEYFGHQPTDGSGDVTYHLDPLWADPNIDAVGIDWYPPLTDWRDGEDHLDASSASGPYDAAYLDARVAGGEGFDWFYASSEARAHQIRTPISDGAYAKPWVFRPKDLVAWWSNPHHDRVGGVEKIEPTAWIPRAKPVWFVEMGCPAIDKGANAPNLFVDPKSAESARPHFSNGARDDLAQRAALEALLRRLAPGGPLNPTSPIYDGPMLDPEGAHLWAWDARPFPAFPGLSSVWADAANYEVGHWLNGRAGVALARDVVRDLCLRAGLAEPDVAALDGVVPGMAIDAPTTPRAALKDLLEALDATCVEREGRLVFANRPAPAVVSIGPDDLADPDGASRCEIAREDADETPRLARCAFIDPARDYQRGMVTATRASSDGLGVVDLSLPMALGAGYAEALARHVLERREARRETVTLALPPARIEIEPGDAVRLELPGASGVYRVSRVVSGREIRAVLVARGRNPAPAASGSAAAHPPPRPFSPALAILDLPALPGAETDHRPLAAVFAAPWPGAIEVWAGADASSAVKRGVARSPACIGVLEAAASPGPIGRWDHGSAIVARFASPPPTSVSTFSALAGANLFALETAPAVWELVAAAQVTLEPTGSHRLSKLLRRRLSDEASPSGAPAGARIVAIDDRLIRLDMSPDEAGAALRWFAALEGAAIDASTGQTAVWARRAAAPLAPIRLSLAPAVDGGLEVRWTRCGRVAAEVWAVEDIPLGEAAERYEVALFAGSTLVARLEAAAPSAHFGAVDLAAAGALGGPLRVTVRQWSEIFGYGAGAESVLSV